MQRSPKLPAVSLNPFTLPHLFYTLDVEYGISVCALPVHFLHARALHGCLQCSIDVTHGYMRASASEMPFCHIGVAL